MVWRPVAAGVRRLSSSLAQPWGRVCSVRARPVPAASAAAAVAGDARRLSTAASSNERPDHFTFPNEGPGNNYDVNWSIAKTGVAPSGWAYLNLDAAALKEYKEPAGKANPTLAEAGSDALSFDVFDDVRLAMSTQLSAASKLFVADGSVKGGGAPIRVISDSAATAQAAAKEYGSRADMADASILVIHSKAYKEELAALQYEGGDDDDDITGATVLLGGAVSGGALHNAVKEAVAAMNPKPKPATES